MTDALHSPRVSVLIPCYNAGAYLGQALQSVLAQTYRDFEIIVVDDGSTDDSPKILKEYAKKDSRIKIVSQKNQGLSGARNTGIPCDLDMARCNRCSACPVCIDCQNNACRRNLSVLAYR